MKTKRNIRFYLNDLKYMVFDRFYYRYNRRLREWFLKILYKPIYYSYWSRDCDMCESSGVGVFYGGMKKYLKWQEESLEWAEGPSGSSFISKEEYEAEKGHTSHRDRIMEAYENGNGSSIYV